MSIKKYYCLSEAIDAARKATNNDKITRFVIRDTKSNKYRISTNYTTDMCLVSVLEFHISV